MYMYSNCLVWSQTAQTASISKMVLQSIMYSVYLCVYISCSHQFLLELHNITQPTA